MKKIKLEKAEIVNFYNSNYCLKETDFGDQICFKFNTKTNINDKNPNSPVSWDSCQYIAGTGEDAEFMRKAIKKGSIVNIIGTEGRYKTKAGKWNSYIQAFELTLIVPASDTEKEIIND